MPKEYPVRCECGKTHQVSGGEAGTRFVCDCRRTVEIPDLRTLRLAVGEPTVSPELLIEALIRNHEVPGGDDCVGCDLPTEEICHVQVDCEKPEIKSGDWNIHWLALLFGTLRAYKSAGTVRGQSIGYRLPLRMCRECARRLSRSGFSAALRKIDVYRHLLEKYPKAVVGRPDYGWVPTQGDDR